MVAPYTTLLVVVIVVFAFMVGMLLGWRILNKPEPITQSDLRIAIGALVAVAWTLSIAAEIVIPSYTVSLLVHGIMGAVVGYLFSEDGLTLNIGGS
jgi:hypothetical protein